MLRSLLFSKHLWRGWEAYAIRYTVLALILSTGLGFLISLTVNRSGIPTTLVLATVVLFFKAVRGYNTFDSIMIGVGCMLFYVAIFVPSSILVQVALGLAGAWISVRFFSEGPVSARMSQYQRQIADRKKKKKKKK